jgi:hypothetical protein
MCIRLCLWVWGEERDELSDYFNRNKEKILTEVIYCV